jgi:tRNA U34 5-methylaminomethyl-2-thiouridine-forming methyltransferase MnmC
VKYLLVPASNLFEKKFFKWQYMGDYQIKMTADGSATIYLPDMDEQYHSLNGAVTEAEHVYIRNGYMFQQDNDAVVFEVGFGAGLNCFLTAIKSEQLRRPTIYYTVEAFPLSGKLPEQLNYGNLNEGRYASLFKSLHDSPWEELIPLSPFFSLYKIKADLTKGNWQIFTGFNIIYFDAFGPVKQPEMWTPSIFSAISEITLPGGIIITYSASGEVRRGLASAGFRMERLPGPPGKKEMLRGIKVGSNN